MRKIIQISVDDEGYLHALCDDGSVWYQRNSIVMGATIYHWERFIDIPQDDIPEQEITG